MIPSLKGIVGRARTLRQSKAIWSLTDQGIVSLGNFFTNILLARNLPQVDYGNYLLIYGVIIFLNSIHTSIIVYPLSVKGSVADIAELRKLSANYLVFTSLLALICSIGVLGSALAIGKSHVVPLAVAALLFWQMQETVRRALMSHLRYSEAVWGDGLSYVGQAMLVLFLAQKGWLSIESTFFVIALTSALAALVQSLQLQLKSIDSQSLWNTARVSWNLGKWNLLGSITAIANIHATPWILAIYHGTGETAAVQAVINILGASNPVIVSTNNLVVPSVAKANLDGGMKAVKQVALKYTIQGGLLLFPFFGLLGLFPRQVLELMYGSNSPYLNLDNVLRLFVLAYTLLYLSQIPSGILGGLEKTKSAFIGQMGSVTSSLLIGIPLIVQMGAFGAGISSILAAFFRIFINVLQIQKIQIDKTKSTSDLKK
ncbi:lipopolysaccharide biosynthesis protein [Cylindrospermum sp. FACHB-282]|uniref:lipopolysaccharide biosynthesis protein n=1 Tax=Cylindrospermum sp. FACHB-282 TaxID=2692794 RepID=UPI001684F769|nr:polysaccharide biosynthesis C-terminal domain-containing protein [Cylindrospermum sp. FACHB-282]MBD2388119.1 polysaccharide biosynthesis C-terminal domain-containing protein [Cylindrospermum sp. FACHB-282]